MKRGEFEYIVSMGDELGRYVEKWIAVLDNSVVASGDDLKEVYGEAKRKYPTRTPFVMKVPADKIMVL